ncbi:hypothetical protein GUJ93_ZPchr0012g19430 [Zizania palustris]|uniref:Uncharacterized protein n=1 Tax=Zizania palustris TaxID=103762 RepID=A0A8J5WTU9_ZIZPA|nr:hypothetical protein GUJ93_ZPchr0012g19430 [Zizania palustris]
MILNGKIDEACKLSNIIVDLESQLSKEKENFLRFFISTIHEHHSFLEKKYSSVDFSANKKILMSFDYSYYWTDFRMTSKTKKLIKAHAHHVKTQDYLKRSQARFERFADLLASDTLKPCNKDQDSTAATEDPYNAHEMSPSNQRHNHVSTARKRYTTLSTSEEGGKGKIVR